MTPTDPTRLLAEALLFVPEATVIRRGVSGGGEPMWGPPEAGSFTVDMRAAAILAASPALRAALELGLAWQRAVDALPEGWVLSALLRDTTGALWEAGSYYAKPGALPRIWALHGQGPTPDAALDDLAIRLHALADRLVQRPEAGR